MPRLTPLVCSEGLRRLEATLPVRVALAARNALAAMLSRLSFVSAFDLDRARLELQKPEPASRTAWSEIR